MTGTIPSESGFMAYAAAVVMVVLAAGMEFPQSDGECSKEGAVWLIVPCSRQPDSRAGSDSCQSSSLVTPSNSLAT